MNDNSWLTSIRRYLLVSLLGHAIWEVAQLPLFTLWHEAPPQQIAFATFHCFAGDLAIAASALAGGLAVLGRAGWPREGAWAVAACVMAFGLAYTAWSEYSNAIIRRTWTYTDAMPLVPWTEIGATPIMQWIIVPLLALAAASRRVKDPTPTTRR